MFPSPDGALIKQILFLLQDQTTMPYKCAGKKTQESFYLQGMLGEINEPDTSFHDCTTGAPKLVSSNLFVVLGPLCYKLITTVNCYLETGLSCIAYWPKSFTYVHCH